MIRKEGESVDEFLARKKQYLDEQAAAAEAYRKAKWKHRKEEQVAELREMWPGRPIDAEGFVHVVCLVCKQDFKTDNTHRKEAICYTCKDYQQTKEKYPGRKYRKKERTRFNGNNYYIHEVQFTCDQCEATFWKRPESIDFRYDGKLGWVPPFCSDYCKWVSKLKTPPKWTRKEWDKIQAWDKNHKEQSRTRWWAGQWDINKFRSGKEYSLGDAQEDANQKALFNALVQYFDEFDDPNRRLHAFHNIIRKLKTIGNDCHVEINSEEEAEEERQLIETAD